MTEVSESEADFSSETRDDRPTGRNLLDFPDNVLREIVSKMSLHLRGRVLAVCRRLSYIVRESWDSINPRLLLVNKKPEPIYDFLAFLDVASDFDTANFDVLPVTLSNKESLAADLFPLIGPHLRQLELSQNVDSEDDRETWTSAVLSFCPNLRGLTVTANQSTSVAQLASMRELKTLSLSCHITDDSEEEQLSLTFGTLNLSKFHLFSDISGHCLSGLSPVNLTYLALDCGWCVEESDLTKFLHPCSKLITFKASHLWNGCWILDLLARHCPAIEIIEFSIAEVSLIPESYRGNRYCLKKLTIHAGDLLTNESQTSVDLTQHPLVVSLPQGVVDICP